MIIKCPSCGSVRPIYLINKDGETYIEMENGWISQSCVCEKCDFNFHVKVDFDIKIKNVEYEEWDE